MEKDKNGGPGGKTGSEALFEGKMPISAFLDLKWIKFIRVDYGNTESGIEFPEVLGRNDS